MHTDNSLLSHVAIVLVRPKYAENVGATARIAYNMGISRLVLIRDERPDQDAMAKMATHKAAHILDSMEVHADLAEALAPFSLVIGTTARHGRQRILEQTPRDIVEAILPELPNNQVALVFGPENTGLSNEDIQYCQMLSAIPTADFSSLNLAQAVAIHCYELFYAMVYQPRAIPPNPAYASTFELEGMYDHLQQVLTRIDFLKDTNYFYWMNNIRQFFSKIRLTKKDAKIIRGVCRQFLWHHGSQDQGNDSTK